jgi:hypothetical protein
MGACQSRPTYLDRYYALQPGRPNGAKRLILLLPAGLRQSFAPGWIEEVGATATLVWRGSVHDTPSDSEMEAFEYAWHPQPLPQRSAVRAVQRTTA